VLLPLKYKAFQHKIVPPAFCPIFEILNYWMCIRQEEGSIAHDKCEVKERGVCGKGASSRKEPQSAGVTHSHRHTHRQTHREMRPHLTT